MRILSIDTATTTCSVAVTHGSRLLAETTADDRLSHARHVMPLIRKTLDRAGLAVCDMNGFAVSRGPGSFTGLRIGIAVVKGLAMGCGRPVVGVSSLEALAAQVADTQTLICAMIDARKGEVYSALFHPSAEGLRRLLEESVMAPDACLARIDAPCVFVGGGAQIYRETIVGHLGEAARFAPRDRHVIRARTLAAMARVRFENGDADDAAGLLPVYIRKPDAERPAG